MLFKHSDMKRIPLALLLTIIIIPFLLSISCTRDESFNDADINFESDTTPPDDATALFATAIDDTTFRLSWIGSASEDIAGYTLYQATGELEDITDITAYDEGTDIGHITSYVISEATRELKYNFVLVAYDMAGNVSEFTTAPYVDITLTSNIDITAPPAPSNLQASPLDSSVSLTWDPPLLEDDETIDGFIVYVSIDGGLSFDTGTDVEDVYTYTLSELTNGLEYYFAVSDYDSSGNESELSDYDSATPGTDTIKAIATPPGGIYNDDSISVTLKNNSGGSIYYSTDGSNPYIGGPNTYTGAGDIVFTMTAGAYSNNFILKTIPTDSAGNAGLTKTDIYELIDPTRRLAKSFHKFSGMIHTTNEGASALIDDPDGGDYTDVVFCGGIDATKQSQGTFQLITDGEVYVHKYGHFEPLATGAALNVQRYGHKMTTLNNNNILITGGRNTLTPVGALTSYEYYDSTTRAFVAGGDMAIPRYYHTSTKLYDGSVLITGGTNWAHVVDLGSTQDGGITANATADTPSKTNVDLYDVNDTGLLINMSGVERGYIVQVDFGGGHIEYGIISSYSNGAIDNGTINYPSLTIIGLISEIGAGEEIRIYRAGIYEAEIFNPDGTYATQLSDMNLYRYGHAATLLQDGRVLITGGQTDFTGTSYSDTRSEYYNPVTRTFEIAGGKEYTAGTLKTPRFFHTATLLADGKVLIAGGVNHPSGLFTSTGSFPFTILSSCSIYDPVSEYLYEVGKMTNPRFYHSATLLDNGKVLVTGGIGSVITDTSMPLTTNTAELYDPNTETWSDVTPMFEDHYSHDAFKLADGHVLIAGGAASGNPHDFAELFFPGRNEFVATAHAMSYNRVKGSKTTPLPDGTILVSGGESAKIWNENIDGWDTVVYNSLEIYNSSEIAFDLSEALLNDTRKYHTATLLDNGNVLIVGGEDDAHLPVDSADLYDYKNDVISPAAGLAIGRSKHAAVKLMDGRVLIIGGDSIYGALASCEIYDPNSNLFQTVSTFMNEPRVDLQATLLPDGRVLIIGGKDIFDTSTEIFDPNDETFTVGPNMTYGRDGHQAVHPEYAIGKAIFTQDSTTVTGTNTAWSTNVIPYDMIYNNETHKTYMISSVDSDTQLTLSTAYEEDTTPIEVYYTVVSQDLVVLGGEIGGYDFNLSSTTVTKNEFYTYDTSGGVGTFTLFTNDMSIGRYGHIVVPLADRNIILTGGDEFFGLDPGTAELLTITFTSNKISDTTYTPINMDQSAWNFHGGQRLNNTIPVFIRNHNIQAYYPSTSY